MKVREGSAGVALLESQRFEVKVWVASVCTGMHSGRPCAWQSPTASSGFCFGFFCAFVRQSSVTALWGAHCGLALKRARSGRGVRSGTPAQEKSSEGFQCALRVFVRACFAAVLQRHCFQGSTWFQPQL